MIMLPVLLHVLTFGRDCEFLSWDWSPQRFLMLIRFDVTYYTDKVLLYDLQYGYAILQYTTSNVNRCKQSYLG